MDVLSATHNASYSIYHLTPPLQERGFCRPFLAIREQAAEREQKNVTSKPAHNNNNINIIINKLRPKTPNQNELDANYVPSYVG